MPQAKSRSPYKRYGKTPYAYTFPRCQHNHKHVETFAIGDSKHRQLVKVDVCNACNTVRSEPRVLRSAPQHKRAA